MHSGLLHSPTNEELKIQEMIINMVKENPKERPSLTQIIRQLRGSKGAGGWMAGNRITTPNNKIDTKSRTSTRNNTE